jgi:hypothetical protein
MSGRAGTSPSRRPALRVPPSRGRRAAVTIASAAGLACVALLLGAARAPHGSASAAAASRHGGQSAARPSDSAGANPSASAAFVPPARWVTLPAAAGTVGQMPTGFPHTPPGAAALGAAVVQFGWTTDLSQARAAAALYADPADQAAAQVNAANLAANLAGRLGGTPASLPAGAGVQASVIGVQWYLVNPDEVEVALLVAVTFYPGGNTAPSPAAYTALCGMFAWQDSVADWRYTLAPAAAAPPADPPGTAGFNAAGWSAVQEATP